MDIQRKRKNVLDKLENVLVSQNNNELFIEITKKQKDEYGLYKVSTSASLRSKDDYSFCLTMKEPTQRHIPLKKVSLKGYVHAIVEMGHGKSY